MAHAEIEHKESDVELHLTLDNLHQYKAESAYQNTQGTRPQGTWRKINLTAFRQAAKSGARLRSWHKIKKDEKSLFVAFTQGQQ